MKRLLAVLLVCLMVVGCSSGKLVIDKGETERYKGINGNVEITMNSMELKGDNVRFNMTIRNLDKEPLSLEASHFSTGFNNIAKTDYSEGTLMPGESVTGNGSLNYKWEKGDHSISFWLGFNRLMDFDFKIQ